MPLLFFYIVLPTRNIPTPRTSTFSTLTADFYAEHVHMHHGYKYLMCYHGIELFGRVHADGWTINSKADREPATIEQFLQRLLAGEKTITVAQLLINIVLYPTPKRIYYCYSYWQPIYDELKNHFKDGITFVISQRVFFCRLNRNQCCLGRISCVPAKGSLLAPLNDMAAFIILLQKTIVSHFGRTRHYINKTKFLRVPPIRFF